MESTFCRIPASHTIEVNRDDQDQWEWHIYYNEEIIASAGKTFGNEEECVHHLRVYAIEILQWIKEKETSAPIFTG